MTKTKSTKRALLMSALALVMCFSMLIGSTYAWFTDTVSTGVNTIQSGTLQVDLQDKESASLEGKTLTFVQKTADGGETTVASPLWEPNATFLTQQFKVVNKGNLNLKYTIVISGIDGNAKLNEVMEWSVIDGDGNEVTAMSDTLAPGAESALMNLKGHMKAEATNEYQGLSMSGVGITVYATQVEAEYDSFGNDYDAGATVEVTDSASLNTAIKNAIPGTTIKLAKGNYTIGKNDAFTNGLADKDITLIGEKGAVIDTLLVTDDLTNVSFVGLTIHKFDEEGSVTLTNVKFVNCNFVADGADTAINFTKESASTVNGLTIEGCSFNDYTKTSGAAILFQNTNGNKDIVIKNNTFTNMGYNAVQFASNCAAGKVEITGNTFNGTGDRALNINATADATIIVTNNNFTSACKTNGEVVKVAGVAPTFTGNTYEGKDLTFIGEAASK